MNRIVVCLNAVVCVLGVLVTALPASAQVVEPTRQPHPEPGPVVAPVEEYTFAIGGRVGGSTLGVGATARGWLSPKVGFEAQVSRFGIGAFGASATVTQFSPAVLYRFDTQAQDGDVLVRPYAGGGLNFFHATESYTSIFGRPISESDTSIGIQLLGGAELVFRDMPRFVISLDLGYHSTGLLFDSIGVGGIAYGVSAHWYFR